MAAGNLLQRLNRPDEALRQMESAIALAPDNVAYRIQAAMLYLFRQAPQPAEAHLRRAIAAQPTSGEAHGWLAQSLFAMNRLPEAEWALGRMLELSPDDTRGLNMAGDLYLRMNQPEKAEGYARRTLKLNPRDPAANYMLAFLLGRQGRKREYLEVAAMLRAVNPQGAMQLDTQFGFAPPGWPQQPPPAQMPTGAGEWFQGLLRKYGGSS
jgi:tetratricopeptide (TPR) repeat protein